MDILLEAQRSGRRRQRRRDYVSEGVVGSSLFAVDALLSVVVLAAFLATPVGDAFQGAPGSWILVAAFMIFPLAKSAAGLYPGHGLARAQRMRQLVVAAGGGLVVFLGMAWLRELLVPGVPRTPASLATAALALAVLMASSDPVARRVLQRSGRWQQPLFIFGGGGTAGEVVRQLRLYPHLGFKPACIVDDTSVYIPDEEHGVPVIRFRELSRHADELALASTAVVIERFVERSLVLQLYTSGIFKRVLLVPACHDLISLNSSMRKIGGTLAIRVASDRPSPVAAFGKRAFDILSSGLALLVLSPVFAALALVVRFDSPGPILFSQPRWAGGDQTFNALKFRTMHVDGERRLRRHFLNNPVAEREYERYRKLSNDPRVTRAGRFLRSSSLDELPQLLNVLRGQMSLVGPRPYTLDELSKLGPARQILSLTRPGITGFWQVSGRNQRTFRERIEMDCYYVRNLSISLDAWIVLRTVVAVLTREGK